MNLSEMCSPGESRLKQNTPFACKPNLLKRLNVSQKATELWKEETPDRIMHACRPNMKYACLKYFNMK